MSVVFGMFIMRGRRHPPIIRCAGLGCTGLLADAYGLSTAVAVVGSIVAGVALITGFWHLSARR